MNSKEFSDNILRKTLKKMFPFERELNDEVIYQEYPNIHSMVFDLNSGRLNLDFPIKIDGLIVEHIGRAISGIVLVFNPINEDDNKKLTKLKRTVKSQNSILFSVKIYSFTELMDKTKEFSKSKFTKMTFDEPVQKLTKQQKDEVELLIRKEGGPHSLIEELLIALTDFNRDYIISVLYYIPEIRMVSVDSLDEMLFRYGIKINWDLIKNKRNLGNSNS